jgi:hypothetical protein
MSVRLKTCIFLFFLCVFFDFSHAWGQQSPEATLPKIGPVEFSGNVRIRYENWGWFSTPGRDAQHDFLGTLLRFSAKAKHKFGERHSLDWQVEAALPGLVGMPRNAVAPAPQGALGLGGPYVAGSGDERTAFFLKQIFARYKFTKSNRTTAFQVGRFEFADGAEYQPNDPTVATLKRQRINERLIGTFGFTHVGRSFDGAQISHGGPKYNLTFVAARPTVGVFQVEGAGNLDEVNFFYGAFTRALHEKSAAGGKSQNQGEARVFTIYYQDDRGGPKTDNRPLAVRRAETANIRITTIGGNYMRYFDVAGGKFDVLAWGAGQVGRWGFLDPRTGVGAVEIGYQFNVSRQPWIRGGYFRSTGDANPNDGSHGTFFQVLPTPRLYARTPFFNLMNNEDIFGQVSFKPFKTVAVRVDAHKLNLSRRTDLWYLGGGAFQQQSFGFVGRPSSGRRSLGTLVDLSADWQANARTTVSVYAAKLLGGPVISAIHPTGSNGHFFYTEVSYRF